MVLVEREVCNTRWQPAYFYNKLILCVGRTADGANTVSAQSCGIGVVENVKGSRQTL